MKNKGLSDVEGVAEQVSKPPSLYKNTHAHIYKDTIMHNKSSWCACNKSTIFFSSKGKYNYDWST